MKTNGGRWAWIILAAIFVVTLLAQRIYVQVSDGQAKPAILELLPPVLALLAILVTILARGRNLLPFLRPTFLLIWGPYLALAFVFPILGVLTGEYAVRTLAAMLVPIVAVAALLLGAEVSRLDPSGLVGWRWVLVVAAVVQAGYAVLQQLVIGNLLPSGPWDSTLTWDIATQSAFGGNIVIGRSGAFYTNPNILGAAAGTALLIGVFAARPRLAYVIVGSALAALLLSQSRGAAIALVIALGFLLVLAYRHRQVPRWQQLIPYAGVIAIVVAGWLVLVTAGAPAGTLIARIGQGITLQDPNITGRIEFWGAGLRLLAAHPFGTFGPPEQLLGTAVDSDWVRALLEGGPIYLAALGLALGGGALIRGDSSERRLVRALSVFIAVAAVTQLPLQYPSAYLYWAVVGAAVAAPVRTRRQRTGADEGEPQDQAVAAFRSAVPASTPVADEPAPRATADIAAVPR